MYTIRNNFTIWWLSTKLEEQLYNTVDYVHISEYVVHLQLLDLTKTTLTYPTLTTSYCLFKVTSLNANCFNILNANGYGTVKRYPTM